MTPGARRRNLREPSALGKAANSSLSRHSLAHWPEAVMTHRRMQRMCELDEKQGRLIPSHLSKQKPMYGTAQPLSSGRRVPRLKIVVMQTAI